MLIIQHSCHQKASKNRHNKSIYSTITDIVFKKTIYVILFNLNKIIYLISLGTNDNRDIKKKFNSKSLYITYV